MTDRLHEVFAVDEADVTTVSRRYALGELIAWEPCGGGLVNSNYRLRTSRGSYLLRCYPAERTAPEVTFEVTLLHHLDQAGFPGPAPVCDTEGEALGSLRGRLFTVLTFVEGDTVTQEELTRDLAEQVGARYADFRRLVEGFRPAGERESADHAAVRELLTPLLADLRGQAPAEAELIETSWAAVEGRFGDVAEERLQVVHGDLFYENIVVNEGRLVAFIDYDDAYLGLPLLDLALVVMEFATPPDNRLDPELATAVLRAFWRHGGEPHATAAELYDALLFLCCKFLAYTLPLNLGRGESVRDNDYLRRLAYLRDEAVRRELQGALSAATTAAGV